ncbi:hypothetical protein KFK09_029285 [Dendrobium nobile]|uniref:Uncharacterized protein n=1 Tax=Dendrobium nobile TaxID=94219 RepID=A0A8T3A5J3_DENNO|nr:hypothetical protein KFK09_029285 [Dendrobium nobile]
MDRLVSAEAAEVELNFLPSKRCTATFKIRSLIHTMPVAVQLTTTRPCFYAFSPAAVALIPPLSSIVLDVVLPPTAAPPITSPPDAILVRSALVPTLHHADTGTLLRFFSRPTLPVFRDATIPILLVGHHILTYLLLSPNPHSHLSRVIPSCTPDELSTTLPLAAAAGDAITVAALIAAGANPNARSPGRKSSLSLAVSAGSLVSVKALIDAGATDRPFYEAAAGNRTDLIFLMLGKFAPGNISWADAVDNEGRTPVHAAAENGCVEALRLCFTIGGGDADLADARGWTPLHYAAAAGHLKAAELIIGYSGFDPRGALTREGQGKRRTPLELAVEKGNDHLYELLRPYGRVIRAARGVGGELGPAVKEAGGVEERDQNGWTALHVAAFKGRMDAVKQLVEGGADLEAVDNDGYTPLKCAVEAGNAEVALWLISCGARGGVKGFLMATGGGGGVPPSLKESCTALVSAALC